MSNHGRHGSPSKLPVTDSVDPLRGSQLHVPSRAESLANAFAPMVTLNHARRKFREHFGAAFLERTLTTRSSPTTVKHRRSYGNGAGQTAVGLTTATNPPTYVKLSFDAVALARLASRHVRNTLVGKKVPLEVFVYYSNAARGCADDQYLKVAHYRTVVAAQDTGATTLDQQPREVSIPIDVANLRSCESILVAFTLYNAEAPGAWCNILPVRVDDDGRTVAATKSTQSRPTRKAYRRMSADALCSLLRERGLSSAGNANTMMRRLVSDDKAHREPKATKNGGSKSRAWEKASTPKDCVRFATLFHQPIPSFARECESFSGTFVLASGAASLRSHTWARGLPYCVEVALLQTKDILRRSQANTARGRTVFLSVGVSSHPALLTSPENGSALRDQLLVADLEVPEHSMRSAMTRGVELQFLFRGPESRKLQSVLEVAQNASRCPWCGVHVGESILQLMRHLHCNHPSLKSFCSVNKNTKRYSVSFSTLLGSSSSAGGTASAIGSAMLSLSPRSASWQRTENHNLNLADASDDEHFSDDDFEVSEVVDGAHSPHPATSDHVFYCRKLGGVLLRCSLPEFVPLVKLSGNSHWRTGFATVSAKRNIYQSQTGQILRSPEEFLFHDGDWDRGWILRKAHALMDQFDDISLHQKEFLKLWNGFVAEFRIHSNMYVQDACTEFARRHRDVLCRQYRHSFLLHLINLFHQALIHSSAFLLCLAYVDSDDSQPTSEEGLSNLASGAQPPADDVPPRAKQARR